MGLAGGSLGLPIPPIEAAYRLRFVAERDVISSAIKWFEGHGVGPSHVDIVLPDGRYLGAHVRGGVEIRDPDYIKEKDIVWERRYAIPVTPKQLQKILDFAHSQVGKGYDISDICSILLHADWDCTDRWICSELALAAAYAGNLFLLNVQPGFTRRVDPGRLHLSPYLIGRRYYDYLSK